LLSAVMQMTSSNTSRVGVLDKTEFVTLEKQFGWNQTFVQVNITNITEVISCLDSCRT